MKILHDLDRRANVRDAFGHLFRRVVVINAETGVIVIQDRHRDDGGTPMREWHGLSLGFAASGLTAKAIRRELRDLAPAVSRMLAGHSVEWDGNNYVGRLTDDARDAQIELATALDDARYA